MHADPQPPPSGDSPGDSPSDSPGDAQPPATAPGEQSFDAPPVQPTPAAPAAPTDALTPEDVQTFADATLDASPLRFALNAFGDVSVFARKPATGSASTSFGLGTFALLINAPLGKSLLATAEVAFDGTDDNRQATTLERLHLRWQTSRFFVVGGRTHTDLGYWNTAFHHGAWLHLPIARPRGLNGEASGGLLPIHWIGIEGGVTLDVDPGTLVVSGGVGNGRGQDESEIEISNDHNVAKAVKLKLEYVGLGWPGLRIGAGALYDRIAPETAMLRPALPDVPIDEVIASAHVAYRGIELTLIAEAYAIIHHADAGTFTTADAFVVAGHRFGRVTPYVEVERTDTRGSVDPFYTPVPDKPSASTPVGRTDVILGTRLDPSVWCALKLEYGITRLDAGDGVDHSVVVNWSFGI